MGKRVLVADDASFMRMMIKDILIKNQYEIADEAFDGINAVEKYISSNPDIVIMDITMPNMDGIQALTEIKKIDANAKVIMCSAMGQEGMVVEAIKSGAVDFIVKPFKSDRIIEALNKALE
jgi:two-component system, chemotaxis family, chemotaxis protein CheY